MYKHYFFLLLLTYLLHFAVAGQNSSHRLYLIHLALHYFSHNNIIYKFAGSTHIHCSERNQKLILFKSAAQQHLFTLHCPSKTQLKSCCDFVTRFRPDLRCTHTHGRRRRRRRRHRLSRFHSDCTIIHQPIIGDFPPVCNPCDELWLPSPTVVVVELGLPLSRSVFPSFLLSRRF